MTGDQGARFILGLLWLVFIASALFARRLPMRDTLRMALAWVAIFALLFGIFAFRGEFGMLWQRVKLAANPQSGEIRGGALRVPMGEDGHFHVRATINGVSVSLLVDSGATSTAISRATAERTGIAAEDSAFGVAIDTANGVVIARRGRIERLEVGPIARSDFPVVIASEFGDTDVLGMNFLSSLSRWGVEGETLILTPDPAP